MKLVVRADDFGYTLGNNLAEMRAVTDGIVTAVDDCSISVDLKGRLGFFKAPRRMFICDTEPQPGQEFGFRMSFPEQLAPEGVSGARGNG